MRAALATARVEWIRFFRDRIAMFSTIALPIVLVLLIGLSFGQSRFTAAGRVAQREPRTAGDESDQRTRKSPPRST